MAKLKMYEVDSIVETIAKKVRESKLEAVKEQVNELNLEFKEDLALLTQLSIQLQEIYKQRDSLREKLADIAWDIQGVDLDSNVESRGDKYNYQFKASERSMFCYTRDEIRREVVLSSIEGKEVREMIDRLAKQFNK